MLGDGKLGLLVAAVLRLTGAELILVGRNRSKLAIAEGWGVPVRLADKSLQKARPMSSWNALAARRALSLPGVCCATRHTRAGRSTYHGALSVDMSGLVVDEITLLGSRCGPFAPALRLLASSLVDPRRLISETFALDQAEMAFADTRPRPVC